MEPPPYPLNIDLTHTLVITGSRTVLKRASKFMQVMARQKAAEANGKEALSLEDYLEWKMGEFCERDAKWFRAEPASAC
mgnify:CR=1 FL=1